MTMFGFSKPCQFATLVALALGTGTTDLENELLLGVLKANASVQKNQQGVGSLLAAQADGADCIRPNKTKFKAGWTIQDCMPGGLAHDQHRKLVSEGAESMRVANDDMAQALDHMTKLATAFGAVSEKLKSMPPENIKPGMADKVNLMATQTKAAQNHLKVAHHQMKSNFNFGAALAQAVPFIMLAPLVVQFGTWAASTDTAKAIARTASRDEQAAEAWASHVAEDAAAWGSNKLETWGLFSEECATCAGEGKMPAQGKMPPQAGGRRLQFLEGLTLEGIAATCSEVMTAAPVIEEDFTTAATAAMQASDEIESVCGKAYAAFQGDDDEGGDEADDDEDEVVDDTADNAADQASWTETLESWGEEAAEVAIAAKEGAELPSFALKSPTFQIDPIPVDVLQFVDQHYQGLDQTGTTVHKQSMLDIAGLMVFASLALVFSIRVFYKPRKSPQNQLHHTLLVAP